MKCNTRYKKKKSRRIKILLIVFVFLFVSVFCYIKFVINPVVVKTNRSSIMSLSTQAISNAVYDILMEEGMLYEDLVTTTFDNEGNIAAISLNGLNATKLSRLANSKSQEYLDKAGRDGVKVALGTFTGLPFLNGFGSYVTLRLTPIGMITTDIYSEFYSVGINQTSHKVYISIKASMELILPISSTTIDSYTNILLTESVLIGKVPNVYLNGGLGSAISLVP